MILIDNESIEEKPRMALFCRGITTFYAESSIVTRLDLCSNQIKSFSAGRDSLPNLKILDISANQLTSFTVEKNSLPKLEVLDLHTNKLTSFVVEENALPNLYYLNLSHNLLTSFSVEKDSLLKLKVLILVCNKLTSFFAEKDSLPNLRELSLSGNSNLQILKFSSETALDLYIRNTSIQFVDQSLIRQVKGKKVEVREHIFETKDVVIEAFHEGNPIADEIIEHLTL